MTDSPTPAGPHGGTPDDETAELQALHEERIANCPLKPCRSRPSDEMRLRDIRTDRLLCSHCAVRTPVGYVGKDVVRESEKRFFQGTNQDYVITFAVTLALTAAANSLVLLIGGFWLIAIAVGFIGGGFIGMAARRATNRRVGRYSPQVAVAGCVLGGLLAPTLLILLQTGQIVFSLQLIFRGLFLPLLICTGIIASTVWGIFQRRI